MPLSFSLLREDYFSPVGHGLGTDGSQTKSPEHARGDHVHARRVSPCRPNEMRVFTVLVRGGAGRLLLQRKVQGRKHGTTATGRVQLPASKL